MTSPIMDHVDLCSGIGGFALGFEWAGLSRPVLFCDIEPWSRKVLRKHWPDVPIAEDVKELASDPDGLIPDTDPRRTILTAGYPCQSFSLAGKRRGTEDDRHIWPYIFSIIQARRPAFCVFENVYGHVTLGLDQVLSDLEGEGYATRPFIVPACAIDAPHRRDRLWIIARNVANSRRSGCNTRGNIEARKKTFGSAPTSFTKRPSKNVANANCTRLQQGDKEMERRPSKQSNGGSVQSRKTLADAKRIERQGSSERQIYGERDLQKQLGRGSKDTQVRWPTEPPVGRVADGIPRRVDRLRGLGNAIVPQIAQRIGETILKC